MPNTEYLTVGELAKEVGVTVRTVQYYDQIGLLTPSIKGSRNQRLYAQQDKETLFKILCLKFMGLSLDEIRGAVTEEFNASAPIERLLEEKIGDAEKDMSRLMKRFATLKNLLETIRTDPQVNWQYYAYVIERFQNDGKYSWKLDCTFEENAYKERESQNGEKCKSVESWHKLIADTISMVHRGVSPEDTGCREIARRYLQLQSDLKAHTPIDFTTHHNFVLFDSTTSDGHGDSFGALRMEVYAFLERAVDAYQKEEHQDDRVMDDNKQV